MPETCGCAEKNRIEQLEFQNQQLLNLLMQKSITEPTALDVSAANSVIKTQIEHSTAKAEKLEQQLKDAQDALTVAYMSGAADKEAEMRDKIAKLDRVVDILAEHMCLNHVPCPDFCSCSTEIPVSRKACIERVKETAKAKVREKL